MANEYFGLILAGGQGTRFWPYSTEEKPKQFLQIVGEGSLISQTYERMKFFLKRENIFLIADRKYLKLIQSSIPEFPESNFIDEPIPRNTAPSLILANIFLSRLNANGSVLVVPADHYIPERSIFARQMEQALKFADNKCIITSGIKPTVPHTGYGYIKFLSDNPATVGGQEFFTVQEFKEKPSVHLAEQYLEARNYYWNSGMFIYKLKHFLDFLKEYAPYYAEQYERLDKNYHDPKAFRRTFEDIKPLSIDFALMEKVREVMMFKADFSWNDVGAWSSVYDLRDKDKNGNVNVGENVVIDSDRSLVFNSTAKPVAIIGVKNITVINTENGVLVAPMDKLQLVKQVIEQLKK